MDKFKKINYDTFLDYLEDASDNNRLLKGYHTGKEKEQFVKDHNIDDYYIALTMSKLGSNCKKVIIKNGIHKGYYIFSDVRSNSFDNYAYEYTGITNPPPSQNNDISWWNLDIQMSFF